MKRENFMLNISQHFLIAFTTSLLAAFTTTAGIYVIRRYENWGRKNIVYFTCFAAGILISASFLHIIPKAFTMNKSGPMLDPYFEVP